MLNKSFEKAFSPSFYNHFYKIDDKYYGINLLSWAILSLNEVQYKLINNFLSPSKTPQNEQEDDIFRLLVQKKFIKKANFNEIDYIKQLFYLNKKSEKCFSLGLAITLGCNFRCLYCYQEHPNLKMKPNVLRAVYKYLEKELPGKESFSISWWGGEPLIAADIIENFGNKVITLCDSLGVRFNCSMSTNGYLLNEKVLRILKKGCLTHLQVTIDGDKDSHNKTRILPNGEGTYDVLIDNLRNLVKYIPKVHITIRTNVGKTFNINGWNNLLSDLAPIKGSIALAPREVLPTENYDKMCLPIKKFDEIYDQLGEIAYRQGFRIAFGVHGVATTYCGAMPNGNWLIHPEGYLHKCTAHAHKPERALGKLLMNGKKKLYKAAEMWLNYSPFDNQQCLECNYLPMCMGGCLRVSFDDSPYVNRCRIKEELPLMIKNKLKYS
jgi:uncharacterized protein